MLTNKCFLVVISVLHPVLYNLYKSGCSVSLVHLQNVQYV